MKKFTNLTLIEKILIGILVSFLGFAGLCMAYDKTMQWYMENSLSQSVTASHATFEACESSYRALLKYKQTNNMSLTGTGDPCPLT